MSVSSVKSVPPSPPPKPPVHQVSSEHSKFKAGLAHQAAESQKSAVEVARPAGTSVHIKA